MNVGYSVLMIAYWGASASIHGFATLILLERGFDSGQIGILLACSYLISALLQPAAAAWMDRSGRLTLLQATALLGLADLISVAGLAASGSSKVITVCMLVLNFSMTYMLQPVTNTIAVAYSREGRPVNFGVARGFGSLAYAASSALSGRILDRWPGNAVFYFTMGNIVLMMLTAAVLEKRTAGFGMGKNRLPSGGSRENGRKMSGVFSFCSTYRKYTLLLLGVVCLFMFHNMMEGYLYLIMEPLGGSAADTGLALGIASASELPSLFLIARLRKRFPSHWLMRASALFFTLKAVCIFTAASVVQIDMAMALQMLGYGLYAAASVYYVGELIPMEDQMKGQALMTCAFTLGGVAGSLAGGALIGRVGVHGMLEAGVLISLAGTAVVFACVQKTDRGKG